MKSIKTQLISVATVLVLAAQVSTALAQTPAQTPANNKRHAQSVGGDGTLLHTRKNNALHAQNAGGGQGTPGARSPEKTPANNAYKHAMNNGKPLPNKPQKPQKPQRPQKAQ